MAASLNTFAAVLLAFPFYLAQKGRLTTYVALAKPSTTAAPAATASTSAPSTSAVNPTTGATSTPSASDVSSAASTANIASQISPLFDSASALFS